MTPEDLMSGLDQDTVEGFAEALCIALLSLKDESGRYMAVRLSNDPFENIRLSKQVATMMLKARNES